jgi:hypothetical protein
MADEAKKEPNQLEILRQRVERLRVLLNTPEGKEIVEALRRQFLTRLQGKDELDMTFKAGCANVVAWLLEAQQYPEGR